MKRLLFLLFFSSCLAMVAMAEKDPNIVIESLGRTIRFHADKSGTSIDKITEVYQPVFRAKRTAGTAIAVNVYDDFVKIDKASGGRVSYGNLNSGDYFFNDSRLCIVGVELKKAGATGKATIQSTYTRPEYCDRIPVGDLYDVEQATVTFVIPQSLADKIRIEPRNIPAGKMTAVTRQNGKNTEIVFEINDLRDPTDFKNEPPSRHTLPSFLIRGHFADTDDFYRYLRGYLTETDPGEAEVAQMARSLTSGLTTDADRIKTLTDWVRNNIRYVAIEHGEFGQRPDLASEVLRKRYGDCKGSASLLKSMLRALGMDARLVWIGTDNIATSWTDFPSLASGNHMIAAVVRPDTILYIDGTAKYTAWNQIPLSLHGREAMIEDGPDRCIIAKVPEAAPSSNGTSGRMTAAINDDGSLTFVGEQKFFGSAAARVRAIHSQAQGTRLQYVPSDLLETFVDGGKADRSELSFDSIANTALIEGQLTAGGRVKQVGSEKYVDLTPSTTLKLMKFDLDDRTVDGYYPSLRFEEQIIDLQLPDGMVAADLQQPVAIDNPWIAGSLSDLYDPSTNRITRHYRLEVKQKHIPLSKLKEMNDDLQKLIRACSTRVTIKSK